MVARTEIAVICSARSGSSGMYGCACCASRYASSNFSASASLTISGSASCRAQRTFALRCAHHAMPLAATASATTAAATRVRRDVRGRATAGCCPDDASRAWHAAARSRTSDAVIVRRSRSRTSVRLTTSSNSGATSGRSVLIGAIVAVNTAWMIASVFVPVERHPTSQHLVGDDAERPEIRPSVHRFTGGLFGRHVAGRARRCCPHA